MITSQHRNQLNTYIESADAQGIHTQMIQLSVADQKQLKLILAQTLSNRKVISSKDSLQLYVDLLPLNLNLYYKSFLLAAESYRKDKDFWENLSVLEPLGEILSQMKAYYRQNLLTEWLKQLKPYHAADMLFQYMKVSNVLVQLNYLIESDSLYGFFLFMHTVLKSDVQTGDLAKLIRKLLIPSEKLTVPQNIREDTANFLSHFFNIQSIQYPFHRVLDTTMFAFAEKDYESFLKVIIPANRISAYLNAL